jgi:molecular chaperone GrpE (heat shock protein)
MNFFGLVITTAAAQQADKMAIVSLHSSIANLHNALDQKRADEADTCKDRDFWKTQAQASASQIAAMVANASTDGPKADLAASDNAQAARAMSRTTKGHFVAYQQGVIAILAKFDKVMKQNSVTKKDLDTVNDVRRELRAILRREI